MRLTWFGLAAFGSVACAVACGIDAVGSMPIDEGDRTAGPDGAPSNTSPPDAHAEEDGTVPDADAADAPTVTDAGTDVAPDTPLGPLLELTHTASPANVDLTTEGALDWAYWGAAGSTTSKRKTGINVISSLTAPIGAGGTSSGFGTTFAWTDAIDGSGSSSGYFYVTGSAGTAEAFHVPAGPATRTLLVWVGGNQIRGKLTATLGAGTASEMTKSDSTYESQSATFATQYTIEFRSLAPAQLDVKWEIDQTFGVDSLRFTAVPLR